MITLVIMTVDVHAMPCHELYDLLSHKLSACRPTANFIFISMERKIYISDKL